MEILGFDHVVIKADDYEKATDALSKITGERPAIEMSSPEAGVRIGYDPLPIGIEVMSALDGGKGLAQLLASRPDGLFCIALRVADIEAASAEMADKGYQLVTRMDNPPAMKEALFDTTADLPFYVDLIEMAAMPQA